MDSHKQFRTYEDQVDLLIRRGMHVPDKSYAALQLERINYYRLSGYWYPFRERDNSGNRLDSYVPGTNFEDVLRLYDFDTRLRIATFAALSDIELWLRANLGYSLGQISAFAHLETSSLELSTPHAPERYSNWLRKYERELSRSKEDFVQHHQRKYGGKLPVWAAVEILDWGALTYLYELSPYRVREGIADSCYLSTQQFQSWLKTLNVVRNTAAHHGRLFNRSHALQPKLPREYVSESLEVIRNRSNRTFALLTLIQHLRKSMGAGPSSMLIKALETYPQGIQRLPISVIGAPEHWQALELWQLPQ